MEETRTEGLADVDNPRLLLLGSDMRFLIALATHPNDAKRETIDMAELVEGTGFWKFRSLDMSTTPPTLSPDDASCIGCHGSPPRPIWGSYPDWPGAFGEDNDILTSAQATALNEILAAQAASDRFHSIELLDHYDSGQIFSLPGRVYPYTNTITNMELGAAVADGIYTRIKNSPLYDLVWRELLLMSYCVGEVPDFYNTPAYAQIVENATPTGRSLAHRATQPVSAGGADQVSGSRWECCDREACVFDRWCGNHSFILAHRPAQARDLCAGSPGSYQPAAGRLIIPPMTSAASRSDCSRKCA